MKIFTDPRLLKSGLIGGTFSRATGPMNNPDNQAKVLAQLGIPSENILRFHQTHSDTLLNISDEQLSYITDVSPGCGLIKVGSALVPFENKFPRNTKLYRLMSTKPGEDLAM